jgi:hypothetical protein
LFISFHHCMFPTIAESKVDLIKDGVFQVFPPFFARGRHEQNFKNDGRAN